MNKEFKTIMHGLNSFSASEIALAKEIVEEINYEHRTIQQKTISTLVNIILQYAENKCFDDRNEKSVKICQKIRDFLVEEENLPKDCEKNIYKYRAPFI
jgi:hypothetical protein